MLSSLKTDYEEQIDDLTQRLNDILSTPDDNSEI